jgi:hypothetical protein
MSDDGVQFVPHLDASFLVVDELERFAALVEKAAQ